MLKKEFGSGYYITREILANLFSNWDFSYLGKKDGVYNLACIAHGEKIDVVRHEPKVDVKAVTRHLFEVIKDEQSWKAKVLLDI